jgi:hypothetical protein
MKKYLFMLLLISLCACKDKYAPLGLCPYPLKWSNDKLDYKSQGGTDTITTSNTFWWVSSYFIVDTQVYCLVPPRYRPDTCTCCVDSVFYGYQDGDGVIMSYEDIGEPIYIEHLWFSIRKLNKTDLVISATPNTTGKNRTFRLGIEAGNCHTMISVNQSGQ